MEALLIINSLLVAICLYFIRDFHGDFKEVAKKVEGLKQKVHELSVRMNVLGQRLKSHIKDVNKRIDKVEEK